MSLFARSRAALARLLAPAVFRKAEVRTARFEQRALEARESLQAARAQVRELDQHVRSQAGTGRRLEKIERHASALQEAFERERARADERARDLRRAQGVAAELDRKRSVLHTKVAELRRRLDRMATRVVQRTRRIPSADVLAGLLESRTAARRERPDPAAPGREDVLRRACDTYTRNAGRAAATAAADTVTIGGLTWHVPADARAPDRLADRIVRRHWLPLRDLAATRDVVGGGVMLDIGANIGTTAIPRVVLGDAAVAYCAEPDPDNYACLVRNVVDNHLRGVVLPDHVAIGSVDGPVRLHRATSIGDHRLLAPGVEEDGLEVPGLRLESWLDRLVIDPRDVRFIKVDTQGWEGHVLAGAAAVLECAQIAWCLEIAPVLLDRAGTPAAELYALIAAHFTHFIDLFAGAPGERVQTVDRLPAALAYLGGSEQPSYTNVVLLHLAPHDIPL